MKMLRKLCYLFIITMALSFFAAPTITQAANAKLNKTKITIGLGQEETLKVQKTKTKVKWSSSNKKIATVSDGTVTGLKTGNAVITAKVGKQSLSCKVTVKDKGLQTTSLSLIATQKETLKLKNITKSVKWSSSNKKVAVVNKDGKVTAKAAGKAKITAKVGNSKYVCHVTVESAGIDQRNAVVYLRQPVKLKVLGAKGKVTWSSSNKKVAKVDGNGKVTAVKVGKATIKATVDGETYKCKVTVKKPALSDKKVSVDERSSVKIKLLGATIKKVKSNDTSIAKVTKKGVITGVKEGKCTITVTDTQKKTYKCSVTVNSIHDINTNDVESPYFDVIKTSIIVGEDYQLVLNDNTKAVAWSSDDSSIASVDSTGLVHGVKAGSTKINATVGDKIFSCAFDVVASGNPSVNYTRGEWISLLLKQLEINVDSYQDKLLPYYCDTTGHAYGKDIEIAKIMGIIPANESAEDVPEFHPDDVATREFAAVTAVSALGYQQNDRAVSFADAGSITYKAAVDIAVKEKLFILSDNYFYPNEAVTDADKVRIFTRIYELINEPDNFMEHSHVKYADNVIVNKLAGFTDYVLTQNTDGSYTVVINNDNQISYLKKGYKVVLPSTAKYPSGMALQLSNDATTANNTVSFTGTVITDISQIASDIDVAGYGTVLTDGITTEDGISVSYKAGNTAMKGISSDDLSYNEQFKEDASAGALEFTFNDKELGGGAKLTGSITVNLPSVGAQCVRQGLSYKEISLSVKTGAIIKEELKFDSNDTNAPFELKLGEVPVKLPAGLNVTLGAKLYFAIDGSISVSYELENECGIIYKDGELRSYGRAPKNDLSILKLEGNAEAGLKLDADLNFTIFPLVGAEFKVGPAIKVSLTVVGGDFDAAAFLSMKIAIKSGDETALGIILEDILHYTELPSWTIFDENNSPFRKTFHFSNGVASTEDPETGDISGYVYVAGEDNEPIRSARVVISRADFTDEIVYTDSTGKFVSSQLETGDYNLKISATGYKTFTAQETITANTTTYTEVFMMIDHNNISDGTVEGCVYNAIGGYVSGAAYAIRNGWNNTTGNDVVASGILEDEEYSFDLVPGNYTLSVDKEGFLTSHANLTVLSNQITTQNVTMSPIGTAGVSGQMRIVLTWGETPSDLDSHLFGPTADGTDRFHVCFYDEEYYENNSLTAMLDVDDVSSYGPETITIYNMNATGIYSYYVHNYSDGNDSTSTRLSTSGARIQVYDGTTLIASYNVPVNRAGTIWHVFDYNAATKQIIVNNEFTSEFVSDYLYGAEGPSTNQTLKEESDISRILESIFVVKESNGSSESEESIIDDKTEATDNENLDIITETEDSVTETETEAETEVAKEAA